MAQATRTAAVVLLACLLAAPHVVNAQSEVWAEGQFDGFETGTKSWTGTTQRTQCTGYGFVLGGHNALGTGSSVQKTFTNLPPHNSIRIQMTFFFISTWDSERALIWVDNNLQWTMEYVGYWATSKACSGMDTFIADVDIIVNTHTATSVTIRVNSTLDQGAADESWAIDNVIVTPFLTQGGAGVADYTQGFVDFTTPQGIAAFAGRVVNVTDCGTLVARSGAVSRTPAFVQAQYVKLPPQHNAIRLSFSYYFLHLAGAMTGQVHIDSMRIWSITRQPTAGASSCSPSTPREDVVEFIIQHTSSSVKIDFTGFIDSGLAEPIFALSDVRIDAIVLGSAPYTNATSDFSRGPDGWVGPIAPNRFGISQRTYCSSPYGVILGSTSTTALGTVVSKTYTALPAHNMLFISATFMFLNFNDARSGQLYIDNRLVWSLQYTNVKARGTQCGVNTGSEFLRILAPHNATSAAIRFGTDSDNWNQPPFGIYNVRIAAINLRGASQGNWVATPSVFTAASQDNWGGVATSFVAACGTDLRSLLRSDGDTDLRAALLIKTFLNIPAHDAVQIELTYVFTHNGGSQRGFIMANGKKVWEDTKSSSVPSCTDSTTRVSINTAVVDTSSSLTIEIWGEQSGGVGSFAVVGITLTPITNGFSRWTPYPSDFSIWSDGWAGTALGRSTCGQYGTILGGLNFLGSGAFVQKNYTQLPPHTGIRVTMKYYFIYTWDSEQGIVYIDGQEVWRQAHSQSEARGSDCGTSTKVADISVVVPHTLRTVQIRASSTLDQGASDEAFGISDIQITPFNATGGSGTGPLVVDATFLVNFATPQGIAPWIGEKTSVISCGGGIMMLNTSSDDLDNESFLSANYVNLPNHNAVLISFDYVFLHDSGDMLARVTANGFKLWELTRASRGVISGCGLDQDSVPVQVYVSHTAPAIKIDVSGRTSSGVKPRFGMKNLRIIPFIAGVGEYSSITYNFASGIDNWIVPNNFERTVCNDGFGTILGGRGLIAPGVTIRKSITNIPQHNGLSIRFTYVYLNWNPLDREAFVNIDNARAWAQAPINDINLQTSSVCGTNTGVSEVSILLPDHTASTISIEIGNVGNQWIQDAFGITDFTLVPYLATRTSSALFVLNEVEDFSRGAGVWAGTKQPIVNPSCGDLGSALTSTDSLPRSMITKTFTNVPARAALEIRMTYVFMQRAGVQFGEIFVDNVRVWRMDKTARSGNCGDALARESVRVVSLSTASTVTIQVWGLNPSAGLAAFAIDNVQLIPLQAGRVPWTPFPSDFSRWYDGWVGSSQKRTFCDTYGWILGGNNVLGTQTSIRKTYTNLPTHNALRIELRYYFFRTWDFESGIVKVDGATEWEMVYVGSSSTLSGCGVGFMYEDVDIVINSHTASEVTIEVSSTLDQNAADESYGIQDVIVTPYNRTFGNGTGPFPADGRVNFDIGAGVLPWSTNQGSLLSCPAPTNSILVVKTEGNTTEAFAQAQFTNIQIPHNVARVRMNYRYLHEIGSQRGRVVIDNLKIWEATALGSVNPNPCSPGTSIDVFLPHSANQLILDVVGIMTDKNVRPGFSLKDISFTLLTLGTDRWVGGAVDTFDSGYNNWFGAGDLQLTTCQAPYFGILGGSRTAPVGSKSYKTYTGLPSHNFVIVRAVFIYFDTWDQTKEGQVYVDNALVWSLARTNAYRVGSECNVPTASADLSVPVAHTAQTLQVTVQTTGTQYSNQRFGVNDVQLVPFSTATSTLDVPWTRAGDSFTSDNNGWNGLNLNRIRCVNNTAVLASGGDQSQLESMLIKTYTSLPAHTFVKVSFTYFHIGSSRGNNHTASLVLDGRTRWVAQRSSAGECLAAPAVSRGVAYLVHSSDRLNVQFWGEESNSGVGSFAVANVLVETGTLGRVPWVEGVSDFSSWPDGWEGTSLGTSTCRELGTILGGHTFLGSKAYLSKTFTDLPAHNTIRVELRYVYVNTWDDESSLVYVDGVLRFSKKPVDAVIVNNACGGGLAVKYHDVDVLISGHTSGQITVRVESTLDQDAADESFGIVDVRITPFTSKNGNGRGPWSSGIVDFTTEAGIRPWTGGNTELLTCDSSDRLRTALVARPLSNGDDEAFLGAVYTNLPSHNALRLTMNYLYLQAANVRQAAAVNIEAKFMYQSVRVAPASADGTCARAISERVDEWVLHDGSEVYIDLLGKVFPGPGGPFQPRFGVQSFQLEPVTLGTGKWVRDQLSNFTSGPDGWIGKANLQRTNCGPLGMVLGGSMTYAKGEVATKTYVEMPRHTGLAIRMTVLIVQWAIPGADNAAEIRITVDNNILWRMKGSEVPLNLNSTACGYTTYNVPVFIYIPDHTASSVTITVSTTESQFSSRPFAIANVGVEPQEPCGNGTFLRALPTATSQRQCVNVTQCIFPREYEVRSPTPTSDRVCSSCSVCGEGFFGASGCTSFQDTVCSRCRVCSASEYVTQPCRGFQNTECRACTVCNPAFQFTRAVCSSNVDTVCGNCTVCALDEFQVSPCLTMTDAVCKKITRCASNEFEVSAPDATTDRQCQRLTECTPGAEFESRAPTATTDRLCTKLRVCDSATEYETRAPTASSDRECTLLTVCGSDQFESVPPSASADRKCSSCSTCLEGQRISAACSATSDTVCVSCTPCLSQQFILTPCQGFAEHVCQNCTLCDSTSYRSSPCTATKDATCAPCRVCDALTEYISSDCSDTKNRECAPLTVCKKDIEYEFIAPTSTSDRVCRPVSKCGRGQYAAVISTGGSDTVCKNITVCELNQYESVPPTNTTDAKCSDCSTCDDPSTYLARACSYSENTLCSPCSQCASGEFIAEPCRSSSVSSNTVCKACRVCASNEFMQTPCSTFNDTVCILTTPCGAGQYEVAPASATSDFQCKPITVCQTNEYEKQVATRTSDTQCEPVKPCGDGQWERSAATRYSDYDCQPITICKESEYLKQAATKTSDASCLPLTPCKEDEWQVAGATATSDYVCRLITQCTSAEFESQAPTPTSDRVCNATSVCGADQWQRSPATRTSDTDCQPLTACQTTEYEKVPATVTSDRQCAALNPCKPSEWEKLPATKTRDYDCEPITFCGASEYQVIPASRTSDTVCARLNPCSVSEWIVAPATKTSDFVCRAITKCSSSQYLASPATLSSDNVCKNYTVCNFQDPVSPTYQIKEATPTSDRVCRAVTICDFNGGSGTQYQIKAPTNISDALCTPARVCPAGWRVHIPLTLTSDRVCKKVVTMVFDLDFPTVIPDSKAREAFSDAIWKSIDEAEVRSALRESFILREGSIIASVDVVDENEEVKLTNMIRQGTFKIEIKTNPAKSPRTQIVPAMSPEQYEASKSGGEKKSSTTNVAIIAGAVGGGLVLIILLVVLITRRKKGSRDLSTDDGKSHVAFANPLYDEKGRRASKDADGGYDDVEGRPNREGTYDDIPANQGTHEKGYLDVSGFRSKSEYLDVSQMRDEEEGGYMDFKGIRQEDNGYMTVKGKRESSGYEDVQGMRGDAEESPYMTVKGKSEANPGYSEASSARRDDDPTYMTVKGKSEANPGYSEASSARWDDDPTYMDIQKLRSVPGGDFEDEEEGPGYIEVGGKQ